VFPHHENELAQSRAAAGPCSCGHDHGSAGNGSGGSERDDFVRYWLHNGECLTLSHVFTGLEWASCPAFCIILLHPLGPGSTSTSLSVPIHLLIYLPAALCSTTLQAL